MEKWSRVKGTKGELNVEISILSKLLVNILVQCAGKVSERAQFSAVDVHFVHWRSWFRCRRCLSSAQAIDGRPCVEVQLADGKLDVVDNFVYLGDWLYSSECWALRQEDKKHLENSERTSISTNYLLSWLKLKSLDSVLKCNRLCCFRHVKWCELHTGQNLDLEMEVNRGRVCPKKYWLDANLKLKPPTWNLSKS